MDFLHLGFKGVQDGYIGSKERIVTSVKFYDIVRVTTTLQWRHNGRDSVSNHQPYDCLFNGLFKRRSKKTSKLRVTGLCAGNSPETGEFSAQMASNAENVSIWWCHHELQSQLLTLCYPVTSATLAAIYWYSCVAIKCQREIPAGVSQLKKSWL